jgi:hypothetical protein
MKGERSGCSRSIRSVKPCCYLEAYKTSWLTLHGPVLRPPSSPRFPTLNTGWAFKRWLFCGRVCCQGRLHLPPSSLRLWDFRPRSSGCVRRSSRFLDLVSFYGGGIVRMEQERDVLWRSPSKWCVVAIHPLQNLPADVALSLQHIHCPVSLCT